MKTSQDETALIPRIPRDRSRAVPKLDTAAEFYPIDGVSEQRYRALSTLAWLLPAVLTGAIVFVRASWPSLWSDELATWAMSSLSWSELTQVLKNADATIGPYYLFMKAWTAIAGSSDLALRFPSMAAMTATAGLIGALGTRLASPRVGVLAGLIFAILPTTSRYAHEARPYALVVLLAVLSTALLVKAMDRTEDRRLILTGYALAVLLLGLFHAVALLLLVAHALIVLMSRRRMLIGWLLAVNPALMAVVPIVYLGRRQRVQVSWIPELTVERFGQLPQALAGSSIVAGMLLVLMLLGVSGKRPAVIYVWWLAVPVAGLAVAGAVTPLWLPRYLLFVVPAWVLLAACAMDRFPVMRGVLVVAVLGAFAFPEHARIRDVDGHSQASRDVGAILNANADPTDAIIFGGNASGDQWVSRDAVARYTDPARRPKDVLVVIAPHSGGSFVGSECPEILECFGAPQRLWVVRLGNRPDPLAGLGKVKEDLLRSDYTTQEVMRPTGFTVALLIRKPAGPAVPAT